MELHEKVLLPFYERFLKGKDTEWEKRPPVEYFVRGANVFRTADTWPPAGVKYKTWYLSGQKTGSVTSLNDGTLSPSRADGQRGDNLCLSESRLGERRRRLRPGRSRRRASTRCGACSRSPRAPLDKDLEIAGPIKLVLYASSTARDTDFVVKLSEQYPQPAEERAKGLNPASQLVTKGWLRASHRALDPKHSTEMEPYHTHTDPQPLKPGEVYELEISVEPNAYRFRQGNRIRLELVNGDSPITDVLWTHYYQPNKIGQDTVYHSVRYPSRLILPVME